MMRRNVLVFCLLLAVSLPLVAAGESYRQELSIGTNDHIKISTDVPEIIIEHNNTRDQVMVSLHGPNISQFRMDTNESRDGIVVEVKRKRKFGINIIDVFGTELRVSIPKDLSYSEIEISSISGAIQIAALLNADEVSLESVSGAITFGDIKATNEVEVESVSGKITGTDIETRTFSAGSVSGTIKLESLSALDGEVEIETVSGTVEVKMVDSPEISMNTISGRIVATLAPSFSGEVKTSTLSGRVETNFTNQVPSNTSKRITTYRLGSGNHSAVFASTSGAIQVSQ